MNDDPDDLAAAFFAAQAAKEKAKATLPTNDWIRAIEAAPSISTGVAVADAKDAGQPPARNDDGDEIIDPSSWLVTKMPSAPTHADGSKDGIAGIVLDSNNDPRRCRLTMPNASESTIDDESKDLTPEEKEMRRRMMEYLVQKLDEKMA